MIEKLKPWFRELATEPTVICCGASAFLIVSHYQGSVGFFRTTFGAPLEGHPAIGALGHFWWFGSALLMYLVMPLVLSVATKGSFHRKYGLGLGDWRAGLKLMALFLLVMVPAVYVASRMDAFKGQYPLAGNSAFMLVPAPGQATLSVKLFVAYEAAYFLYFVGWEFLFRGWMLNGLLPSFGRAGALLIPILPFAVMHLGKAELEALGSIVAGLALGVLALRTRSFWYGAALHGLIAVYMDVLSVWPRLTA